MRNIAIRLRYDGSTYHGWQLQKEDITVASVLEDAIGKVCGHPVRVTGCGRTDAGVHALRYCANFRTDCSIPAERIPLHASSTKERYNRDSYYYYISSVLLAF